MRTIELVDCDIDVQIIRPRITSRYTLKSALILVLASFLLHCAQMPVEAEKESIRDSTQQEALTLPVFPVPIATNAFEDQTFQTNGTSFFKTTTELNEKLNVHTGTCAINGHFEKDRSVCNASQEAIYDHQPTQIYRVNIGVLHVGEVFQVLGACEFTNNLDYGVVTGTTVILSANPNQTQNYQNEQYPKGTDYTVVPQGNYNLFKDYGHHGIHTKVGAFMVTQSMKDYYGDSDAWVIMLGWANANPRYLTSSASVVIEHGDGSLSVIKQGNL